jgi:hypothetical protein
MLITAVDVSMDRNKIVTDNIRNRATTRKLSLT